MESSTRQAPSANDIRDRARSEDDALLDELKRIGPLVEEHDYLDHPAAIRLMAAADRLCVTLGDLAEVTLVALGVEGLHAEEPSQPRVGLGY